MSAQGVHHREAVLWGSVGLDSKASDSFQLWCSVFSDPWLFTHPEMAEVPAMYSESGTGGLVQPVTMCQWRHSPIPGLASYSYISRPIDTANCESTSQTLCDARELPRRSMRCSDKVYRIFFNDQADVLTEGQSHSSITN